MELGAYRIASHRENWGVSRRLWYLKSERCFFFFLGWLRTFEVVLLRPEAYRQGNEGAKHLNTGKPTAKPRTGERR